MHNKVIDINCDSPVTIIVKRLPRQGKEKEFEKMLVDTSRDAMKFEGHLGVNIIRPIHPNGFYRIVFKFDSLKKYIKWEESNIRQSWIKQYNDISFGNDEIEILNGLETWITLNGEEAIVPPPRYKVAIIVWLVIFPLSVLLNYLLNPFLSDIHFVVRSAAYSIILVMLMTYVLMPFMSKLFHRWLHCQNIDS